MDLLCVEESLSAIVHAHEPLRVEHILPILQRCRRQRSTASARFMYAYMQEHGLDTHKVLGNHLIPALVECGSLPEAEDVFGRMHTHRNEHSWTCLIGAYARQGDLSHALQLYHAMQDEGVYPSNFTFVALLKASSLLRRVDLGREIHSEVCVKEFENDIFVGNSLIDMYAKCGCLSEAQEVFDTMPVQDVVSWNTLIAGYSEYGDHEEAVDLFRKMSIKGFSPDVVTYLCILKVCGKLQRTREGLGIHSEIIKEGLEHENLIRNSLVDMYSNSGLIVEAQNVFDDLQVRDVFSWNSLIAGYAEIGLYEEAVKRFHLMQEDGVLVDSVTFLCMLKACGTMKEIHGGRQMHTEAVMRGIDDDLFVGNTVVDMYLKCEAFCDAKNVFDGLQVRDAVSWNALLTDFGDRGFTEEALDGFHQMQAEGISTISTVFLSLLKSCGVTQALGRGHEIHAHIIKLGFDRDLFVNNSVIDMYAKCGALVDAIETFNLLRFRDVVSWNTLIAAYVEHGYHEEVLQLYGRMQVLCIPPDATTFVCVLKSCSMLKATEKGWELHEQIVVAELERVLSVSNSLVMFYVKSGFHSEAKCVFEELPSRDVVSWTLLISGCAEEQALAEEGLSLFEQMMEAQCVQPDPVIMASCLKCCGNVGALGQGREIHLLISKYGFDLPCEHSLSSCFEPNMAFQNLRNALIDMYAKCGDMADAQKLFSTASMSDQVSWNALIAGYARQEDSVLVFRFVQSMMESMVLPDDLTFLSILSACSHGGLLNEGQKCFKLIPNACGTAVTIGHYNCVLDLFGRSGQVDEATEIVKCLPLRPTLVTWSILLDAYRRAGDVGLSKKAFESAVQSSQDNNVSSFILMSNIYAAGCLDMEEDP